MGKDKGAKAAAPVKEKKSSKVDAVKSGRVTKASEKPKAVSKETAKKTAKKVSKKGKKEESSSESSSSESESESEDESSSSSSESDEEKPAAKKANGKKEESSDSSDSDSDSSSESEEEKPAPKSKDTKKDNKKETKKPAPKEESSDDSSSDSSDDEAEAGAKDTEMKDAESSDDSSDSDSDSDSDEKETKKESKKESSSDDSSDSDSDSDEEEEKKEEAPSKKRKAEEAAAPAQKKIKAVVNGEEKEATANLFVGNLSWNIDEEWLTREFEEFGELQGVRIITDRDSGRSKGFGYVEFTTVENGAKALEGRNGYELDGRPLRVDFSTPRDNSAQTPQQRQNDRATKFGDVKNPPAQTLFVGNISFDADESTLTEYFQEHGSINSIRLPTDRETGAPKGFGYVEMGSIEEAQAAFDALQGADVAGRPIRLDFAQARDPSASRGGFGGDRGGRGGRGGGRGGFGDRGGRGGRGGGRGGFGDRGGRGGRGGGSFNRGGFGDFSGKKVSFD